MPHLSVRQNRAFFALLLLLLLFSFSGCTNEAPTPTATPQPEATEKNEASELKDVPRPSAWPNDEAIAYCPPFDAAKPISVVKQEGNQAKAYVINYAGITMEQYNEYVEKMETCDDIIIDTNTNLRGNAYSFNGHKVDDSYMMVRLVYTRVTETLVISVTYARPDVTPKK